MKFGLRDRTQHDNYLEERNVAGKYGNFVVLDLSAYYEISPNWNTDIQVKNVSGQECTYVWYDSFFQMQT